MRILYADAGLRNLEGHHASLGIALPAAFQRLGHQVVVLGHRDLAPALREVTGAEPFFRAFSYGGRSHDPLAGWLINFTEGLEATVSDLRQAWIEFGPFELAYFTTATPVQLAALALWAKEAFPDQSAAPVIAVELGPDPGLTRSGPREAPTFTVRDPAAILYRYVTDWVGREWIGKLTLLAVNTAAAEEFSFILKQPVKALTTPQILPKPRRRLTVDKLTIGLLGHQRIDKGYEFAPDFVPQILQKHANARFIIHQSDPQSVSQDDPPRVAWVTAKLRELAAREPRIEMILQPVTGDAWFALIDRCDIIALPYDPPRYAGSYSAIFGEALASGAPIVAPAGTTMSTAMADAGGIGTTFAHWTVPSIVDAIGTAIDRFDGLAERAYQGGIDWRKQHGPNPFVAAVIDAAGLSGATGTARLAAAQARRAGLLDQPLPNAFLQNPRLQNGASIQGDRAVEQASGPKRRSWLAGGIRTKSATGQLASIINKTIETSSVAWQYALLLDVDARVTRDIPPGGRITVEVSIEVGAGRIGIAWLDKNYSLFSIERLVLAIPDVQRVVVSAPSEGIHQLMIRNAASEGTKTLFTIRNLRAKISC